GTGAARDVGEVERVVDAPGRGARRGGLHLSLQRGRGTHGDGGTAVTVVTAATAHVGGRRGGGGGAGARGRGGRLGGRRGPAGVLARRGGRCEPSRGTDQAGHRGAVCDGGCSHLCLPPVVGGTRQPGTRRQPIRTALRYRRRRAGRRWAEPAEVACESAPGRSRVRSAHDA